MDFKNYIRDIQDFPEKGILFKDITPLLQDPIALKKASEALLEVLNGSKSSGHGK